MTGHPTLSAPPARLPFHHGNVAQRGSHLALTRDTTRLPMMSTVRTGRIDAVIVPASRGAAALDEAANLAADIGATLVALCSRQTQGEAVAERVGQGAGCRTVVVDVPSGYRHDLVPTRTVAARFRDAGAGRTTDLSIKRNIGLLLARLRDWRKILFLDDDIGSPTGGSPTGGCPAGLPGDAVRRLVSALDRHQIAGLTCSTFPDNSVVCHARRLAGFHQETFVSGAALGVNCNDHPLPFFPDLYNEDWFFCSRRAAARELAHVGDVVQAAYDPFETPERARREEFGDLLAEGLFTLFEDQPGEMEYRSRLDAADARYWEQFIAEREAWSRLTSLGLEMAAGSPTGETDRLHAALRSVDAADEQLSRLTAELCVDYLAAWADDLVEWEQAAERIRTVRTTAEAMDFLGLRDWYGVAANQASWT